MVVTGQTGQVQRTPRSLSSSRIRSDRPAADRRIPHGPHISAAVFGRGRPVPGGRRRNRELLSLDVPGGRGGRLDLLRAVQMRHVQDGGLGQVQVTASLVRHGARRSGGLGLGYGDGGESSSDGERGCCEDGQQAAGQARTRGGRRRWKTCYAPWTRCCSQVERLYKHVASVPKPPPPKSMADANRSTQSAPRAVVAVPTAGPL